MAANELKYSATLSAAQFVQAYKEIELGATKLAENINRKLGGSVEKTLNVRFKVDDKTGAREIAAIEKERLTALDAIISKQKQLSKTERGSVTSLRQQVNEAKQVRDGIARVIETSTGLGDKVKTINPLWEQQALRVSMLQRQLDLASASGFWRQVKVGLNVQGLANFSNGLIQVTQGFQAASIIVGQFSSSLNTVIQSAANLQQFALTFKAIGVGASGATQALSEAKRIALGVGVNINTVQDAFQQLTPVITNSGGSINDVARIVEALSSRFAAFGLSGDKARRVTNGVIQAFAKGKLQAEELTQQISEADPAFGTDFAKSVGVSVAELQKMVKAGEITTDVLINALPGIGKSSIVFGKLGSSAQDAARALASGSVTIEQVRQQYGNLNELSLRDFAKSAEPAINSFFNLQAVIVDFFRSASQTGAIDGIAQIISTIVNAVANLTKVLLSAVEVIGRIVGAFSPLISLIAGIPGLVETAAIVFTGKLLASFKATDSALNSASGAWKNFSSNVAGALSSAKNAFRPFAEQATLETAISQASLLAKSYKDVKTELDSVSKAKTRVGDRLSELTIRREALQGQVSTGRLVTGSVDPALTKQVADLDRRIASLSAAYDTLQVRQARLTPEAGRAADALKSQMSAVDSANASFSKLVSGTSGTEVALKGLSNGVKATGSAIGGALRGAASTAGAAVAGLTAALGPIGIALLAVSVAQSAYQDATASARAETDRQTDALKALTEQNKELSKIVNELSSGTGDASASSREINRLGTLEAAWRQFGQTVSEAWKLATASTEKGAREASIGLDRVISRLQGSGEAQYLQIQNRFFEPLAKILPAGGIGYDLTQKIGLEIAGRADLAQLIEDSNSAKVQLNDLADASIATASGIKSQAAAAKAAIPDLQALQRAAATDTEAQGNFAKQFAAKKEVLQGLRANRDQIKTVISDLEKANRAGILDSIGKGRLSALKSAYSEVTASLNEAERAYRAFGSQSGATTDAILREILSIGSLADKIKGLKEQLESAIPGSREFSATAARLSAADLKTSAAKAASEDPLALREGTQIAFDEISAKIQEARKELLTLRADPEVSTEKIDAASKKIGELNTELSAISINRYVINARVVADTTRLNAELEAVNLQISMDPGPLRDTLQLIGKVQSDVAKAQAEYVTAIAAAQSGVYSQDVAAEKLAQASTEFEIKAKAGAGAIADSARQLLQNLEQAQGRLSNLVLGKPEFFTAEEQARERARIEQAYNQEVAKAGFTPALQGKTANEIALQKQAFVEARKEAEGLKSTIEGLAQSIDLLAGTLSAVYTASQDRSILTAMQGSVDASSKLGENISSLVPAVGQAASEASGMSDQFYNASIYAERIKDAIKSLDGMEVSVRVAGIPGRWAGGPTTAGQVYQVNEIGQEGFLSPSGRLTPINRPRNALWRAPSSGMVIPAHIMDRLDAPSGGVKVAGRELPVPTGNGGMQRLARLIQAGFSGRQATPDGLGELASVQAQQALQIGKLSRAVSKLADKDWNVDVHLRNTGNAVYLDALNRRL